MNHNMFTEITYLFTLSIFSILYFFTLITMNSFITRNSLKPLKEQEQIDESQDKKMSYEASFLSKFLQLLPVSYTHLTLPTKA